ncbi:MAG: ACR3 family arsenite efflux transporter [Candidatus Micrarchaeota archaeon]
MKKVLNNFEKYLYVWVFTCMLIGILFSQYIPGLSVLLNSWQIGNVSIPIGICLFLMMYPALLNFQIKEVKKLIKAPKPILLTLLSNWIIAPIITVILANIFLKGYDQLIIALILLGSSPCTAMVIVWGSLAKGNQEQNVITTSINTLTIMFLYAPVVVLLTGIQGIPLDVTALLLSVLVFIGLPLIMGHISKKVLVAKKGLDWFETTYKPIVGKISILALLFTLIVLFTLNGDVLLKNPGKMLLVSVPLLLGFVIIVAINIFMTKLFKLKYKEAIISVIIGSSSHFEIAIATSITLFGLSSQAALGTTMGLFWEVPVMLGLVYLGKFLHKKEFWLTTKKHRKAFTSIQNTN